MRYRFKSSSEVYEIDLTPVSDGMVVKWKNRELRFIQRRGDKGAFLLDIEGSIVKGFAVREKDRVFVQVQGRNWSFEDITDQPNIDADGGDDANTDRVMAPMPGTIIKLLIKEGDQVKRNQPLVIVEAMKMENEVLAPADAVVEKILVTAGQQVGFGEPLIMFQK